MNNTSKFNDYMFNILLEQIKTKEMNLFFSPRFKSFLISIDHPIADKLLKSEITDGFKVKKTYIDLVDDELDMVSFITVPKAIELISSLRNDTTHSPIDTLYDVSTSNNSPVYKKNRSTIKINKLVNQFFPDEFKPSGDPGNDMESFVNIFKSLRDKGKFELVEGDDIVYWYLEDHYSKNGGGSLSSSCMAGSSCASYIDFYAKNKGKVSLLILKDNDDDTKIRGRALVWKLDIPEDRIFMDRIYTLQDYDVELFKSYAKDNGWLYKLKQNMNENEEIVDTKTGESRNIDLKIDGIVNTDEYPYMDTMKFYSIDNESLSNDENEFDPYYKLESTSGDYEESEDENRVYVDYYDERFDIDDLIYCERVGDFRKEYDCYYSDYYSEYIANDYAEENMIDCDYYVNSSDTYRDNSDCTLLSKYDEYATDDYLSSDENDFVWSGYEDEWLKEDDAVYSDHHSDYLSDSESIKVYTDAEQSDTDWRGDGDDTYFEFDGEYYDNDVDEDDLKDDEDDEDEDDEDEDDI